MGRPKTRRGRFVMEQKREEAQLRQEARDKRSPQEQLNRLDLLLGKNQGAQKERMKLHKQLEQDKK